MNNQENNLHELSTQFGKQPPQAIEIEEAIIGAMMLERDCFINNPVKKEWFYKDKHQIIIGCIEELVKESVPIDLMQVTKRVMDKGQIESVGGPLGLTQLTRRVASAAHVEHHIRIIQQEYARRELIRITSRVNQMAYDSTTDIDDIFTVLQSEISSVMSFGDDTSSTYKEATEEIITILNSEIVPGIKTGFAKFDKFAGGLHNSDLVIVAGETSQGKTSLALSAIRNCVKHGINTAIYSLEMPKKQLAARLTAQSTGISSKKIMYNNLSKEEKGQVLEHLLNTQHLPIYFDETSNNDVDRICTSIRKLKIKHDIGLVMVDFIQDMKGADTEAGVADIGRKLKNIAKELDIPIIAISQLARDKNNPEPTIARLRGSGQLEEKADVILLLYRPEVYGREYSEPHDEVPVTGTAQVKIAKGRNIGIGSFILNFNKETTNFFDYGVPDEYNQMPVSSFYEKDIPVNETFESEKNNKNITPF